MNTPITPNQGVHHRPVQTNAGLRSTLGSILPTPIMQRILIVLLATTAAVTGWFAFQYHSRLSAQDARLAALTAERDAALAAEKAALAATDPLRENVDRLTRERDRLQAQASMQRPPENGPGGPQPGAGGPNATNSNGSALLAMLKTPEGKKMFQNQSAQRVRTQYTDFAKKMKLSPQDTTVLMGLLADRQTAIATARATSGAGSAEAQAAVAAIQSEFGDKLKATLGQEATDQFNEYDQSVPERTAVNQFADQFNSAGTPLEETQKESLVQLMKAERDNSPPNPFDPTKNDPNTVLNMLKDDTTFAAWEKQQQDYSNRVLQNAAKTLSPDQVNTLKQVLDQKTERDKTGLQMFKTTGTPPPRPPPGQ